jgi:hypothetical protein
MPDPDRVREAVRQDIVEHQQRTRFESVTFGDGARLVKTSTWAFVRKGRGFEEISPMLLEDFCLGIAPISPDAEGLVHAVEVCVQWDKRRPIYADVTKGLRLRASREGRIVEVHEAEAYGAENDERDEIARRFEERRNESVIWALEKSDVAALRRAVNTKAGAAIFAGVREKEL